jgi:hypothetical protein
MRDEIKKENKLKKKNDNKRIKTKFSLKIK